MSDPGDRRQPGHYIDYGYLDYEGEDGTRESHGDYEDTESYERYQYARSEYISSSHLAFKPCACAESL